MFVSFQTHLVPLGHFNAHSQIHPLHLLYFSRSHVLRAAVLPLLTLLSLVEYITPDLSKPLAEPHDLSEDLERPNS